MLMRYGFILKSIRLESMVGPIKSFFAIKPRSGPKFNRVVMALLLVSMLVSVLLVSGCISSSKHTIELESKVVPGKVSLERPEPINVEAKVTNIGTSQETVTVDVINKTEGLFMAYPNKTTFTLKPGESRTITFIASMTFDAVPGEYIIDIQTKTVGGDVVIDSAKLQVVEKRGLL
jgi:uncharacterized membrane protein